MGFISGCLVYLVLWWVVLFAVLPWKISPPINLQPGHDAGAPLHPHIKGKMIITSGIAGILWLLVYYLIHIRWIPLEA